MKKQRRFPALGTLAVLLSSLAIGGTWAQQPPPMARPPMAPAGMPPGDMPPPVRSSGQIDYTAALYVADGAYLPERSRAAATLGSRAGNAGAAHFAIESAVPGANGLIVHGGASPYTVSDATITLSGNGSNDFEGIGAGVLVDAGGSLVLRSVSITTSGVLSSATTAREKSVLKVYDSTLVAHGGRLPAGYVPKIGPGMMEPPAPLGIKGTARAHLSTSNSKTYFYNSTIIADGWGALSTDDTGGDVYLEANNCDIQVNNSGYGAYADNGATVVIDGSRMKTATYGGIIAGTGKVTFDGDELASGDNAVMIHSVMGNPAEKATLVLKGGRIVSGHAAVLVKSANADITIEGAQLLPGNGALVQSIVNADPNATRVNGQAVPGIHVTLKHAALKGNILHQDRDRQMLLAFDNTRLEGAIDNAVVSFDALSHWLATADSHVVLSGAVDLAQLDAPAGVTITARASDGATLLGRHGLASGGTLIVNQK